VDSAESLVADASLAGRCGFGSKRPGSKRRNQIALDVGDAWQREAFALGGGGAQAESYGQRGIQRGIECHMVGGHQMFEERQPPSDARRMKVSIFGHVSRDGIEGGSEAGLQFGGGPGQIGVLLGNVKQSLCGQTPFNPCLQGVGRGIDDEQGLKEVGGLDRAT
jgi:hypothetical protein